MKALFLPTPDINAAMMANLLVPWCNTPVQSFQNMETGINLATLIDGMHQDIFFDAQKKWFQIGSEDLKNIGQTRPNGWPESTFTSISTRDQWLICDSRLCLTAPFWQTNLKPDISVIAYSEPLACAVSLSQTWRFPISVGLALWEYYLLSALKNCKNQKAIFLSLSKFHHDRSLFNRLFAEQLATFGYAEVDTLEKLESVSSSILSAIDVSNIDTTEFLTTTQAKIFNELEQLDLEAVTNRSLSPQSRDLLHHYGDLRAGYERLKVRHNTVQQELYSARAGQASPINEETPLNAATSELQNLSQESNQYVEVSVQVQDMQQLEFVCSKNADILTTLQEVLQNPTEYTDKLLFLNYGQNGTQTLYFPGSSLLGINIVAI